MEHFEIDFICSQLRDSTTGDPVGLGMIGPLASEFHGLEGIPVSVLFRILSHHLLVISSEDDFFHTSALAFFWIQNIGTCSNSSALNTFPKNSFVVSRRLFRVRLVVLFWNREFPGVTANCHTLS
jgi:hypothetical protein